MGFEHRRLARAPRSWIPALLAAALAHGAIGALLWSRGFFAGFSGPPAREPSALVGADGGAAALATREVERPRPLPAQTTPRQRARPHAAPTAAEGRLPGGLLRYDAEPAPALGAAEGPAPVAAGPAPAAAGPAPAALPSEPARPRPAAKALAEALFRGVHLPAVAAIGFTSLERCPTTRCLTVYVAPWCPACRKAIPLIKDMRSRLQARQVAVRVVVGADRDGSLREAAATYGPDTLLDERNAVDLHSFPSFLVSDSSGAILAHQSGAPATREFIEPFLNRLGLGEGGPAER